MQIDLEANPAGLGHADQEVPKELKNPIHLKTSGSNLQPKERRCAYAREIEFIILRSQTGTAVGAK